MGGRRWIEALLNFIEDRRIDDLVYKNAPGYQDYYRSMYERYYYSKTVDQGLKGKEYREGKPTNQPKRANVHPTVKPLDLMGYLVKLITPPKGTVLDPFCGSGSTLCSAALEGFKCLGIEREAEYVEIAKARYSHWSTVAQKQEQREELPLFEGKVDV